MSKRILSVLAVMAFLFGGSYYIWRYGCNAAATVNDPVLRVGSAVFGMDDFETFKSAIYKYPAASSVFPYFPSARQPITLMAEVEVVYQATRSSGVSEKFRGTLDWEWKNRYYAASAFVELLSNNLGFTDDELKAHYNKNTESFRITTKAADGESDSSFIPEFDAVKRTIADDLFYDKYKPDSSFIESFGQEPDSAAIRGYWISSARYRPENFFMRQIFKEQTGTVYADSMQQLYGEGKPIGDKDLEVIRSWVHESERNRMLQKDLVEHLYRWKVFSERAENMGLTNTPRYKNMMLWATRFEHVIAYLEAEVLPAATAEVKLAAHDTSLARLVAYDRMRTFGSINENQLTSELDNLKWARIAAKFDSVIYDFRKGKITFMTDSLRDDRDADPRALLAKADSLRDLATDDNTLDANSVLDEAESVYRILANNFAFTPEGRGAFGEVAKIQIDKYSSGAHGENRSLLTTAIDFYRRGQKVETDLDALCTGSFMIGFTYDEHMKIFKLAEVNYKWILQNTPDCKLAADAEFMIQHLDEPMTDTDEIRNQVRRQGREVDFDDDIEVEDGGV